MFHHHVDEKTPLLGHKIPPRHERTPLPRRQLNLLLLCRLVEPIAFTSIFSFVNRDIELDTTLNVRPDQVGLYSGCVESVFALCQAVTVLFYGALSDRIGRRPVILFGLLGTGISIVGFGFSKTFILMMLSRSLGGFTNGNSAVIRTSLGEITDRSNEALAFSFLATMWPLGTAIGPFLGGVLANPTKTLPGLFGGSKIFETYPYLLSCLATSSFAFAGVILGAFWLQETKHKKMDKIRHVEIVERSPSFSEVMTLDVKRILLHNAILGFLTTCAESLLPLVLYTPTHLGGLGATEAVIGKTLSSESPCALSKTRLTLDSPSDPFGLLSARHFPGSAKALHKRRSSSDLDFRLCHSRVLLGSRHDRRKARDGQRSLDRIWRSHVCTVDCADGLDGVFSPFTPFLSFRVGPC
jgi:MFS family permease